MTLEQIAVELERLIRELEYNESLPMADVSARWVDGPVSLREAAINLKDLVWRIRASEVV